MRFLCWEKSDEPTVLSPSIEASDSSSAALRFVQKYLLDEFDDGDVVVVAARVFPLVDGDEAQYFQVFIEKPPARFRAVDVTSDHKEE